jgi:hypothetical protein
MRLFDYLRARFYEARAERAFKAYIRLKPRRKNISDALGCDCLPSGRAGHPTSTIGIRRNIMPKDDKTIGDNSQLEVDYADLETFISDMENKQKAISEATGSLRSHLKSVLADTGWHKRAAGMIREINAMSETTRADFLRTFEPMFDVMLSKKWRDEAQDIFSDTTTTEPAK